MPGMDGFEVVRHLRSKFPPEPHMYIVALTGRGSDPDRQATQAASFDGHLDKPIGITDLQFILTLAAS
jgi:CheY-like chemotaxis protein